MKWSRNSKNESAKKRSLYWQSQEEKRRKKWDKNSLPAEILKFIYSFNNHLLWPYYVSNPKYRALKMNKPQFQFSKCSQYFGIIPPNTIVMVRYLPSLIFIGWIRSHKVLMLFLISLYQCTQIKSSYKCFIVCCFKRANALTLDKWGFNTGSLNKFIL